MAQTEVQSTPGALGALLTFPRARRLPRPDARGKFLFAGDEKLTVRGVTYGTFRPGPSGEPYPVPTTVARDFAQMAANEINAVRTYTPPPRWLLDLAARHGLFVMVSLPWEQHLAFLGDRERPRLIEERVRAGVRACAGHPAVLCYAVGNEIPAPIVRWHGRRRIERFIERLYGAAKDEDPDALVTYVNYPSTEYLDLPFLDLACFNVYLESRQRLDAYLARLQNLVGDRPLLMGEIGLDARTHGEEEQARALDWQVRAAFASGCCGSFVFSWTDEWHRGGEDVEGWEFGLVDRERRPKPALAAVRRAYAELPFGAALDWPRVSVVICSRNGEETLRDCLGALSRLDYPDFEVILVDDGSTDSTARLASEYRVRTISTEPSGLSAARNVGLAAATGEIVAYIDGDAFPDADWLRYLAASFRSSDHVGIGGPNLPVPGDGPIAECVAQAPGGPIHVLLSDRVAEHIPGCNMAFRKSALEAIGGFDPQFRAAGDDVDVCWRLQQVGGTLGFSPAAVVWHHRRNSVRAYWRQQVGYGKAEALLERKWPERYNAGGHVTWGGRMYGSGFSRAFYGKRRIRYGTWGSGLFQSVYQPTVGTLRSLPLMPEWYLVCAALAVLSGLGLLVRPLLLCVPLLALALGTSAVQAARSAGEARFAGRRAVERIGLGALTAGLHLLQPAARLAGRMRHGLTPWRRGGGMPRLALPRPRALTLWSDTWSSLTDRLSGVEDVLRHQQGAFRRGGEFDRWDLELRSGLLGGARLRGAIEEHGSGKQLIRFRCWPRVRPVAVTLALAAGAMSLVSAIGQDWRTTTIFAAIGLAIVLRAAQQSGSATVRLLRAVEWASTGTVALEPSPRRLELRPREQEG